MVAKIVSNGGGINRRRYANELTRLRKEWWAPAESGKILEVRCVENTIQNPTYDRELSEWKVTTVWKRIISRGELQRTWIKEILCFPFFFFFF